MITAYAVNILEDHDIKRMISELRIKKISQMSKLLDPVAYKAVFVTVRAMSEGFDGQAALEMGNVVLVAAGRAPISADDIGVTSEENEHE